LKPSYSEILKMKPLSRCWRRCENNIQMHLSRDRTFMLTLLAVLARLTVWETKNKKSSDLLLWFIGTPCACRESNNILVLAGLTRLTWTLRPWILEKLVVRV
jgi:hypothetical protein